MQKRAWFICLGLIGISIALVFCVMWMRRPIPVKPFNAVEAHQTWVMTVSSKVATLPLDASPEQVRQARESLSALTVRSEDKELHLSLILGLIHWEQKDAQAPAQVLEIARHIN